MNKKILLIDSVHPALHDILAARGWAFVDGTTWEKERIEKNVADFDGIVIRSRFKIDSAFLQHATGLKFIARAGAGMENIDTAAAAARDIACINAPEGNRNAVAEHAMGMLLALLNHLVPADREVREGRWLREENRGVELEGKTIGIVGFGNTGKSFAEKLKGFDTRILVVDPYISIDAVHFPGVNHVTWESLYEHCDILSLHVPLTSETKGLVNLARLSKFKKPVYLLNTSRGKVVESAGLVDALKSGIVAGAALDVLDFESLSFEQLEAKQLPGHIAELFAMRNVVLSPHVAGWTVESHRKISEVLAAKIIAGFPG